jgi:RNA polymerase sigma-70 factor (ECF subfamily)
MSASYWPTTSVRLVSALRTPEDHAAWERFQEEYAPALMEFCRRRGLQTADAEDVVQSVFLGAYRTLRDLEFSSDRGRFRSWLSTIALRAIWKIREQKMSAGWNLLPPQEFNRLQVNQRRLADEINETALTLAVDEVKAEFDPQTWNAFSSIWFDGERPRDVAARLNQTPSWVYKAKFNVLQRLKCVIRRMADGNAIDGF